MLSLPGLSVVAGDATNQAIDITSNRWKSDSSKRHAVPAVYSGTHMVGSAFHSKVRVHRIIGGHQRGFYVAAALYGDGAEVRDLIPGQHKWPTEAKSVARKQSTSDLIRQCKKP